MISPRRISAICVENIGYPRTKALVPSIGSTSHRFSAPSSRDPVYSPKKPKAGKRDSRISRIAISAACSAASSAALSSGERFMCATIANLVLPSHPKVRSERGMGNRLSKIYTRTGDDGSTGLGDGTRVAKDSLRVEAFGTVDETNSAIGVVLAVEALPEAVRCCLTEVQHDLFDLGGELCIPGHRMITAAHVERLEAELDGFNESLPPLKEFILPGGGAGAAAC